MVLIGYRRANGRVGVAAVTCGPGLTRIGTSPMAASRNRSGIVIITAEWPKSSPNDLRVMDHRRIILVCEAEHVAGRYGLGPAEDNRAILPALPSVGTGAYLNQSASR